MDPALLAKLADLAVVTGANVQPGQIVGITADVVSVPFVRALTRSAYARGARFVDPFYFDSAVKRSRLELADPETLDFVPSWYGGRYLGIGEHQGARISVQPNPEPAVLEGIDPARAGRDGLPFVPEIFTVINDRSTNWTVVANPTEGWARTIRPELEPADALAALEADIVDVCRLDEPDPDAAWQRRAEELEVASTKLNERRFDALHYEGPGTDLTIGLLPTSHWTAARSTTAFGVSYFANVPTEEVWTAPDPTRADGVVRSTKPLDVEGAARLGEVALVDREGRVGRRGTVFLNTLLDENAASHLALGNAYASSVAEEDRHRLNESAIHIDFMIGGDDVAVTGITRDGERVPVLREGRWQL